ncbi:MAG: TetR/AcrR family transcriptional regulator [Nitrospirales bacterium]|nr:TetR/AcrR family transcriptional regulator [Nitrospirales bacterium]
MDQRTKRKLREVEARRAEILCAAERLFSKHGFFKTNMAEIANAAQFAMGTVYKIFESKEEIYISLMESKVEELMRLIHERIARAETTVEKIRGIIQVKLAFADCNRDFFRIYVSEWGGFEWTVKSAFGDRVWRCYLAQITLVADLVREGIRKGEFQRVDPESASLAFHGMLNATIYVWILQVSPQESLASKGQLLGNLFLNGIENPVKET